jgi:hypothetical protein
MSYHAKGNQVHDEEGRVLVLSKSKVIRAAAPGTVKDSDRVLTPAQFIAEAAAKKVEVEVEGYVPPKKAKEEKSENK